MESNPSQQHVTNKVPRWGIAILLYGKVGAYVGFHYSLFLRREGERLAPVGFDAGRPGPRRPPPLAAGRRRGVLLVPERPVRDAGRSAGFRADDPAGVRRAEAPVRGLRDATS